MTDPSDKAWERSSARAIARNGAKPRKPEPKPKPVEHFPLTHDYLTGERLEC